MADFKELIDSIRKEQVTLFLGSGFSRKAGAPMANAIVTSLKESMPVDIKDDFRDETHLDLISEEYEQIYGRESLINKLEEIFKFMPTDTSDHTCLTKIPHIRHISSANRNVRAFQNEKFISQNETYNLKHSLFRFNKAFIG